MRLSRHIKIAFVIHVLTPAELSTTVTNSHDVWSFGDNAWGATLNTMSLWRYYV